MKKQIQKIILPVLFLILIVPQINAEPVSKKLLHKVEVIDFFISQQDLACKESISSIVNIRNLGNVDERVYAEISSSKLNINEFSQNIIIPDGGSQNILLPLKIDKETKGRFEFEIRLYTEQGIKRYFKNFNFEGCKEPKITSLIKNKQQIQNPPLIKEENSFNLPIVWIITVLLIFIIFILAIILIIVSFLQEIRRKKKKKAKTVTTERFIYRS